MAAPVGSSDSGLTARLFAAPYGFEFFEAVRILRMIAWRAAAGRRPAAGEEAVRFHTLLSLGFPPQEIMALSPAPAAPAPGEPKAPAMTVSFMGTVGPSGTLPHHYTEALIHDRQIDRDTAAHEFLDLFNHRLVSLFYEVWEKHRYFVPYERGEDTAFTRYLLSLLGLGTGGLRGRLFPKDAALADESLVYYAGLLAQRPPSASALAAVLSDQFGVPAVVEQFRGRWLAIEADDVTRLDRGERNNRLGVSAVIGDRVWDHTSMFRVRLGPVDRAIYDALLPGGPLHALVQPLIRFHVGPEMDYDLQLVLSRDDVPAASLDPAAPAPVRLGWSTWLKTAPFPDHADDCVLPAAS